MKFWQRIKKPTVRGRVHRIGIIQGGELSVVIRFGVDEPRARELLQQGGLVSVILEDAPAKGTTFKGPR